MNEETNEVMNESTNEATKSVVDVCEELDQFRITRWLVANRIISEKSCDGDEDVTVNVSSHTRDGEGIITNDTWARREHVWHVARKHRGIMRVTAGEYVALFHAPNDGVRDAISSADWDEFAKSGKARW